MVTIITITKNYQKLPNSNKQTPQKDIKRLYKRIPKKYQFNWLLKRQVVCDWHDIVFEIGKIVTEKKQPNTGETLYDSIRAPAKLY